MFFMTGLLCAVYCAENVLDGVFSLAGSKVPPVPDGVFAGICFALAAFLAVCAASLRFTLRARFYYTADKNQARPGGFLSFSSGVRYINYRVRETVKKAGVFLKFTAPFWAECFVVAVWLKIYGARKITVFLCFLLLLVSLLASLVCTYVRCRCWDEGVYLMYLNPRLPPKEALSSAEEKTAGKLIALAVCRLSTLPKRLACLLLLPLPVLLPRVGVFSALVCEKIYGEDKRKVKQPAVTFYINKKTKMELHETER